VLDRIASDAGELAWARRAGELTIAAVLSGRRAERRRCLTEPDLDFHTFCRTKQMPGSTPARIERAWDAWQARRHRRGEAGTTDPARWAHPGPVLTRPIRWELIAQQYDQMVKYATALRLEQPKPRPILRRFTGPGPGIPPTRPSSS
jgi:Tn3 transposase DDE domain